MGYPYAVRFSICPDSLSTVSGVLFSSPHATFYTNWEALAAWPLARWLYLCFPVVPPARRAVDGRLH